MSAEAENLAEAFVASWNQGDADATVAFFADGAVWKDVGIAEPMTDRAAMRAYVQAWYTALPGMKASLASKVSDGDRVAGEVEFTGTNTGPLQFNPAMPPIPATGREVHGRGTFFARVQGGKIVEVHTYPDNAGMMMQLGMMG